MNGNDQPDFTPGCTFSTTVPGCEVNFSQLPANFGVDALNEYGCYPRTWNLEQGVEIQHELFPRLSLTGSWFHGSFRNLTTTVDRSLTFADYTPVTLFNPVSGQAFTAFTAGPWGRG